MVTSRAPPPSLQVAPLRPASASKQGFREVGSKVKSWIFLKVRSALEGPRMTHLLVGKAWPTEKPPRTYDNSPGASKDYICVTTVGT